jgi:hypothetical protein
MNTSQERLTSIRETCLNLRAQVLTRLAERIGFIVGNIPVQDLVKEQNNAGVLREIELRNSIMRRIYVRFLRSRTH